MIQWYSKTLKQVKMTEFSLAVEVTIVVWKGWFTNKPTDNYYQTLQAPPGQQRIYCLLVYCLDFMACNLTLLFNLERIKHFPGAQSAVFSSLINQPYAKLAISGWKISRRVMMFPYSGGDQNKTKEKVDINNNNKKKIK